MRSLFFNGVTFAMAHVSGQLARRFAEVAGRRTRLEPRGVSIFAKVPGRNNKLGDGFFIRGIGVILLSFAHFEMTKNAEPAGTAPGRKAPRN